MKKTIQKKKSMRKALASLILCSFLLSPIAPALAEENVVAVPAVGLTKSESIESVSENTEKIAIQEKQNVGSSNNDIGKDTDGEEDVKKDERDFSNIVRQTTEYTCGPAALATLINLMGGKAEEMEIAKLSGTTEEKGTTMLGLKNASNKLGFKALGKKVSKEKVATMPTPFLAYTKNEEGNDHFVVVKKNENDTFFISDPGQGNIEIESSDFIDDFGGSILVIEYTEKSQIIDPITGEMKPLSEMKQASLEKFIDEMTDDELLTVNGKFAGALIASIVRALGSKMSMQVTKHAAERMLKYGISMSKATDVFKKGTRYYDLESGAWIKVKDGIAIIYDNGKVKTMYTLDKIKSRWIIK